ncbi:MAG: ABC transporter substrate-binding protein [bacterium]
MRKLAWLIAIALLSICCQKEAKKITLMIGGAPAEIDFWEQVATAFTDSTGIEVALLRQPADTDQRRQTLLIPLQSKEKDPDVFLMDIIWIGQFAASNWLEPLDKYVELDGFDLSIFFQRAIDLADRFNGMLVALPVYIDAGLLYYRKDLLDKYGFYVPQTWEQLVTIASDIQSRERTDNPGFWGFVWQGAEYEGLVCNFLEYAHSNRGGLHSDGRISIDSKENIDALTFMRDLIIKYQISPPNTYTEMKEEEVRALFEAGNALFERNWPYAWMLHQSDQSLVKGKVGVSVLPRFEDGENSATLGGWHIAISSYSDAKELAWSFIKYVLSYDMQLRFALKLGWNPSRRDVYKSVELIENLPHLVTFQEAFDNAVARPVLPFYTLLSKALQREINASLGGIKSPEEALGQAQKQVLEIIDQYKH